MRGGPEGAGPSQREGPMALGAMAARGGGGP